MAPNFSDVTFSPKAVMLANPLQAGIGLQAYHLSAAMLVLVRVFVLVNLLQASTGSHLSAGRGQLRARLTSQLGVTARWPHPSTAPSLPLPSSGPSRLFERKKHCCIPAPPPSPILQHKSFSFLVENFFTILFWPRSSHCLQRAQFQLKYDSPVVLVVSFHSAQTLRLINNFAEPSVFP